MKDSKVYMNKLIRYSVEKQGLVRAVGIEKVNSYPAVPLVEEDEGEVSIDNEIRIAMSKIIKEYGYERIHYFECEIKK